MAMNPQLNFGLYRNSEEFAQGVVFANGKVALAIESNGSPFAIYDSFEAMYKAECQDDGVTLFWDYYVASRLAHLIPQI